MADRAGAQHLPNRTRRLGMQPVKVTAPRAEAPGLQTVPPHSHPHEEDRWLCGLMLRLSVLTLTLAPSAERARHMTLNLLRGGGLPATTGKIQLWMCNQPEG